MEQPNPSGRQHFQIPRKQAHSVFDLGQAHVTSAARPTLGFLTANIHIGASRALWPGVLEAAAANDANLICFPGGRLRAASDFEAQRNVIFELVNANCLDGLVSWTSALAETITSEEAAAFHRAFYPLPIVSLASPIDHGPSVAIDSYQGMRALIAHLVDHHHYRRVAILRGPEGHAHALERYTAYLDALHASGLRSEPALISPPVSWDKGAEALQVLLDDRQLQPGVDFQAVAATSDLLAIGALNLLAERGIRVPDEVAVVGFNDIEEGRLVRPPLTSVSLPFSAQGRRAIETLLASLHGQAGTDRVVLPSRLLVRQSCGCASQSIDLAALGPVAAETRDPGIALLRAHAAIVAQIVQVISNRGVAATWAKQLLDAFRGELTGKARGQFRSTLDSMLQQGVLDGDETAAWQGAISILRRELLPALDAPDQVRAEDLFGQARVVIGEAIQRAQIARQLQAERQSRVLREVGQALITTFDVDTLANVLAERLPELGIASCYLALYENRTESTEWSRLVLAYADGRRADLGASGRRFASRQLVPPDLRPGRRYSWLVEPLYFQSESLGFVVFEVGPREGAIYEVLRGHLSSALKGALLFREAHAARLVAERADQIKTRLLANVSHELRTPLNIIIGHTQRLRAAPPAGLDKDLEHIQHSAEHQLRIINDLLDLSRAEINALDLYPVLFDPSALIEDAFTSLSETAASPHVTWRLELPDRLPWIEADPVRLRQILLNLLSNAAKFTEQGQITLGAALAPPHLHLWVTDTGPGIPPELVERIYEPFFTRERPDLPAGGIGLGLSITRHLVALHQGLLTVESQVGQGSTFHLYLPLPSPGEQPAAAPPTAGAVLWLVSSSASVPPEIVAFGERQQLEIQRLTSIEALEGLLAKGIPRVVAWDMAGAAATDWSLVRRLHNHPHLTQTPFVLFQPDTAGAGSAGPTSLVVKPASSQALWEAMRPIAPPGSSGSILIVDDDARARQAAAEAARKGFAGYAIRLAVDGAAGLAAMLADPPSLVILDLMMPGMDGFEVLDRMRADARTRQVPVVILSGRQLSLVDVKRLEQHGGVQLQTKGLLADAELIAALHRYLFGTDSLPPETGAVAKRALAYLQQHYARSLSRWEIAAGCGVSEDYLSRVFSRELGLSPWDYLNRYRILRAKELLRLTQDSVHQVGARVGFSDPAYFSRVFRRLTGQSPSAYRKRPDLYADPSLLSKH